MLMTSFIAFPIMTMFQRLSWNKKFRRQLVSALDWSLFSRISIKFKFMFKVTGKERQCLLIQFPKCHTSTFFEDRFYHCQWTISTIDSKPFQFKSLLSFLAEQIKFVITQMKTSRMITMHQKESAHLCTHLISKQIELERARKSDQPGLACLIRLKVMKNKRKILVQYI